VAVLIEGVCLLLRCDAVERVYPGGVAALAVEHTAEAVCADDELVSLTFADSDAAEDYLAELEPYGLRHLVNDMAVDAVFADPHIGPISPCGWAEYGQATIDGDPNKRVALCAMPGADVSDLCVPKGWRFQGSLSEQLELTLLDNDDDDVDEEEVDDDETRGM
jgi:hypothetical protein